MQAIDQRRSITAGETYVRVMAAFGTLVAIALIALAIVWGAVVISGTLAAKQATSPASVAMTQAALDFRAGERGDAAVSAAQLQNQFRAGERGDASH